MIEVLRHTDHRPWPLPRRPWVMFQRWHDLLFAHWPVAGEALRPLVPASLELDLFEGRAWVGVVPFRMSHVRLRGTPAVPRLSALPELNLRTYVTHGGAAGVYFFSLDAASPLAVRAARAWFHLPYFHARITCAASGESLRYRSTRTHRGAPPAQLVADYGPGGPPERAAPGSLAHWLTERYCLFACHGTRVWRGDVHHRPWPLQPARARFEAETLSHASGIALPRAEPLLHFARRLDVCIWAPRRVA